MSREFSLTRLVWETMWRSGVSISHWYTRLQNFAQRRRRLHPRERFAASVIEGSLPDSVFVHLYSIYLDASIRGYGGLWAALLALLASGAVRW